MTNYASPTFHNITVNGTATGNTQPPLSNNMVFATTAYTDEAVSVETSRAENAENALQIAVNNLTAWILNMTSIYYAYL